MGPEDDDEPEGEEDDNNAEVDVQDIVRQELEAFSAELESSNVEITELFDGDNSAKAEAAAADLAGIPEAMAAIRSARGAAKGRGEAFQRRRPPAKNLPVRVDQREMSSPCWGCGEKGHWTGDKECPAPGARESAPPKSKSKGGGR
eukprot:2691875-Pyramimonas_sp.AAC.1